MTYRVDYCPNTLGYHFWILDSDSNSLTFGEIVCRECHKLRDTHEAVDSYEDCVHEAKPTEVDFS